MKIFISHSFKDSEIANLIKQKLLAQNIGVIQVESEPKIGDNIAFQIEKAVQESDAYIILLSKHYLDGKWSDLELLMIYDQTLERKKGKRIFPILIDKSAKVPSLLKNIAYADLTDKNLVDIDKIISNLKTQLSSEEIIESKKIRNLLKEQQEFLKYERVEYQIQKNKQKRLRNVFRWSFLLILITSLVTTILIFVEGVDFNKPLYLSIDIKNIMFYALGFLTAIIPSLYLSIKLKNKENGK